ncbi:MAG: CtsR family transcriptional regulator [Ruminococcaceae bacterium]|nr:CtsR family transcriptional regulator [Oscillospiraceae bacterium]
MGISDRIETFLIELLKNEPDGSLEIGRNELASIFQCVPSQINYVIATRFGPQQGYLVESRRGGGGYLRIRRVQIPDALSYVISGIGETLDYTQAKAMLQFLCDREQISEQMANVMLSGISEKSLAPAGMRKNQLRAEILKNMLMSLS